MANLQKFGSYDLEAAKSEQQDLEKSGGGNFLKLNDGRTVLRFLPPAVGKKSPFVTVYQHFYKVPGNASVSRYVCPRMMAKEPCAICSKADQLKRSGNPADSDAAYDLFAKRRVYANVINREDPEKGVQVYAFGKTVHEALAAIRKDEDAGGDFTNPQTGFDIVIDKKGTGKTTEYKVLPARKITPLGNAGWLDQMPDLDRFAVSATEDEMAQAMGGSSKAERVQAKPVRGRTVENAIHDDDDVGF